MFFLISMLSSGLQYSFSINIPLLYPPEIPENRKFSYVFSGHRSGTLVENGLKKALLQNVLKEMVRFENILVCFKQLLTGAFEICFIELFE